MKTARGIAREKSIGREEYLSSYGFNSWQWEPFFFQINKVNEILALNVGGEQRNIIEIGRGSGFVNAILNELGYNAESLDINVNLRPTYVGDISDEKFKHDMRYDLVLCAEVLEHVPFERFDTCIKNIADMADDMALITLPNYVSPFRFQISLNGRSVAFLLKRIIKKKMFKAHYWELNYADYCTNEQITRHLNKYFIILEEGMVKEFPYHYYYVLKKRKHN